MYERKIPVRIGNSRPWSDDKYIDPFDYWIVEKDVDEKDSWVKQPKIKEYFYEYSLEDREPRIQRYPREYAPRYQVQNRRKTENLSIGDTAQLDSFLAEFVK